MKRFNVLIPKEDGSIEIHRMKEWLRRNPDQTPAALDPTFSTSHQLRDGLKKLGWAVQETPTEVRLTPPGRAGSKTNIDAVLGEAGDQAADSEIDEANEPATSFALEYQLRDFIAQNIEALTAQGTRLRLYVDPAGRDGVEYPSAIGPIDILALDGSGAFVVFELKRARSPDHAIGQLLRYMGWVKQTIGRGHEVHGIIVAQSISENLRYAIAVVPNVSLFEYEVSFQLNPVFAAAGPTSAA